MLHDEQFSSKKSLNFDPLGQPTFTDSSDNYILQVLSVCPHFSISRKKITKFHVKLVIVTGGAVNLAKEIIDDTSCSICIKRCKGNNFLKFLSSPPSF